MSFGMLTEKGYSSGHLVLSNLGLAFVLVLRLVFQILSFYKVDNIMSVHNTL